MNARYVILRVLLEAGQGLVELRQTTGADGKPDLVCHLDRSKLLSVGKPAIATFLNKLHVYKSLGDLGMGSAIFNGYGEVPAEMAEFRAIVVARKEPRKLLAQPHMHTADGAVALQTFEQT